MFIRSLFVPKPIFLAGLAVAIALGTLTEPSVTRGFDALRIALEAGTGGRAVRLFPNAAHPKRTVVGIDFGGAELRADLYDPGGFGRKPGMILVNGVVQEGRRYPELVNLAYALSRAGVMVLAPDLVGYAGERLAAEDVDVLVRAFRLLADVEGVDRTRIGYVGFSVGGSLAFVAAADPAIAKEVAFVAMIGPYAELPQVVRTVTTGAYGGDGTFLRYAPEEFVWAVTRNTLIATLSNAQDRAVLNQLFTGPRPEPTRRGQERYSRENLSSDGKAVYDVFTNREPGRVEESLNRLPGAVQAQLRRLSPLNSARDVQAKVLVLHERGDPFFPSWESEALIKALPRGQGDLTVSSLIEHAELRKPAPTPGNVLGFYIPEGWKLGSFIYTTLAEAGA